MAKKPRKVREPRITERDVFKIVRAIRLNFLIERDAAVKVLPKP